MAKRSTAQARIDNQLRTDFDWALDYTGLGETQFLEACIKALVEEVREKGEIRLPLALIPKSQKRGKDASTDPPSKMPAGGMQQTAGRRIVGAASGGGPETGSRVSPRPNLNEDAPQEIPPVIPAREKTPKPAVTRTRAVLREMQKRERREKP